MKIVETITHKILYDSEGEEKFFVSSSFFEALKAGKVKYMTGGKEGGLRFSEIKTLDLKDRKFDSVFGNIAKSEIGKLVMRGEMSLDTIL